MSIDSSQVPVALASYNKSPNSLGRALELCEAFSDLSPHHHVMIKPNLVAWNEEFPIAPFGVYTTTRLVEDLVILLKDHGCRGIRIGEGSVEIKKGVGTKAVFAGLGYTRLAERYGLELVDFNESKSKALNAFKDLNDLNDLKNCNVESDLRLHIAEEALESDFFINMPVLKTHGQTKVSLGLKNLKGCLKTRSKKFCHHPELNLEYCFSHIADLVKPDLTIIDGIYALEKGALHFGNAYRKNLIVASKDILGADLLAAHLIGFSGEDIAHFRHYGERHDRSLKLEDYPIAGEDPNLHTKPLKWDWAWTEDNTGPGIFAKLSITGPALPKYDDTLCSGCSPIANMANILVMSAFKGKPLARVEVLNGKKMQGRPGYDQTVLLGDCIIRANEKNRDIRHAVEVKGCPPSVDQVAEALKSAGLDVKIETYRDYMKGQSVKYHGKAEYDPRFFAG